MQSTAVSKGVMKLKTAVASISRVTGNGRLRH